MNAAQQLSDAVMKSGQLRVVTCSPVRFCANIKLDPDVVRQSPDMTIQMTGRKERLSWLIGFINENTVMDKVDIILVHYPILNS